MNPQQTHSPGFTPGKQYLIDKIRNHINDSPYDYKFEWGYSKEKWGAKYFTIKSLAREFNCPKTSLYIPIKKLVDEGFVTFDQRLISYEHKL